jgi:hypothetical protein
VYPLGWGADWAVARKQGVQPSRTELGLTLYSRRATLELSALRLGVKLGASHSAAESCVVGHEVFKKIARIYPMTSPAVKVPQENELF